MFCAIVGKIGLGLASRGGLAHLPVAGFAMMNERLTSL